jgi:unsaturated rhamnogalacturonyl hydrolase
MRTSEQYFWGWRIGVPLTGAMEAYDCTGDQELYDYVADWFEWQYEIDEVNWGHVNDGAPGVTLLRLYADTRDEQFLNTATALGDYFVDEYPQADGALLHAPDQLWVDTTFMAAPFLVDLGNVTGDERYSDLGVAQILQHDRRLSDEAGSGLWRHGWDVDMGQGPVHWGRGNGWGAAATADVLTRLPSGDPRREEVAEVLTRHVEAIVDTQSDEGAWHTIVDDPSTYLENSGTTMMARACLVAHQEGLVGDEALEAHDRALEYLESQIEDDGELTGVSGPTGLNWDVEYYKTIMTEEPQIYAQGTLLMLLSAPR